MKPCPKCNQLIPSYYRFHTCGWNSEIEKINLFNAGISPDEIEREYTGTSDFYGEDDER
jgi:hypothetical protein